MSLSKTFTVTYTAPKDDSKVTEMYGITFYDGKPEQVELTADQFSTLNNNPVFTVDGGTPPPESGSTMGKRHDPPHAKHDR